jgi:two-component system, OmpR family, sensor histidine kinase BaeS
MRRLRRVGLRARLAAALAAVAAVSVALATVLANSGVSGRLEASAEQRLRDSARHIAEVAAEIHAQEGGWTPRARRELAHLGAVGSLRVEIDGAPIGGDLVASAPVVVGRRTVGELRVTPVDPTAFREPDRDLHRRLNRLHLLAGFLAGGLGIVAALLLAVPLTRPLRRLTDGARRMQDGDLSARVEPSGGAEIEQLAQALNRLAATLEHEEELRKEATADLAHELRTPLTGIISRIEAAQDGVLADDAANLEAMHTEALRLKQLLADLGSLAEAQQPALLLARTPVELGQLIRKACDLRAPAFDERGLTLVVDDARALIAGDPARIRQVVDNLLSNALRYTDRGGTVTARSFVDGEHGVIEVADTGIGLSADELPHVFDRFWRSDKSRARSRGGAGIGLAIVRELVRAHDGRIDVASRPGQGSTFTVRFPQLREPPRL